VQQLEEQCRVETRKLYEQEGRLESLGEAGIPDALQEWLDKSQDAVFGEDGYRNRSRHRLRKQCERLELIVSKEPVPPDETWLGAGAAMLRDSAGRAKDAFERGLASQKKAFDKRWEIWSAAKAKHDAALRPQLSRPDAADQLAALRAAEEERNGEAIAAAQVAKEEVLRHQVEHAKAFARTADEQCAAALRSLDALVLTEDLGHLPGDELMEKKRKSLKRLRKLEKKRVAAGEDPDADPGPVPESYQMPDGRHWPSRTWAALDVSRLKQALQSSSKSDAGASSTQWIDDLTEELSSGPESLVTTAHRQVLRARDEIWQEFLQSMDHTATETSAKFEHLIHGETHWRAQWVKSVEKLVNAGKKPQGEPRETAAS